MKEKKNPKHIYFYYRKEEYGYFSNFERSPQTVDDVEYFSNEHYYQSEKTDSIYIKIWIREAPSAWLAMKAGRSLRPKEMRKDWSLNKLYIMKKGLMAKFSQNKELKKKLLETGDAIIHEDSPTDMFWGIKGHDWLGKLLMEVREELKIEE